MPETKGTATKGRRSAGSKFREREGRAAKEGVKCGFHFHFEPFILLPPSLHIRCEIQQVGRRRKTVVDLPAMKLLLFALLAAAAHASSRQARLYASGMVQELAPADDAAKTSVNAKTGHNARNVKDVFEELYPATQVTKISNILERAYSLGFPAPKSREAALRADEKPVPAKVASLIHNMHTPFGQ